MSETTAAERPLYLQPFAAFSGKSAEQKMQELMDREELRELIARYALCIANGHGVGHLFTDDGAYLARIPGRADRQVRGREAIDRVYEKWTPGPEGKPKPMIHNYLLEIDGDEARGVCSNEVRSTENGQSVIGSGYYEDRFRREGGQWKFTLRDSGFHHWVPIQKGWAEPA